MSFKQEILGVLEGAVEQVIEQKSDLLVDAILKKLTSLIPGNFDDALAAANAPAIKAEAKAFFLGVAEKIDGQ